MRNSLGTQVVFTFCAFALTLAVGLSLVCFAFLYTIEDTFLERELDEEARVLLARRLPDGGFTAPTKPHIRLYSTWASIPDDLRASLGANPRCTEFYGEEGRHYHVLRLNVAPPAWLVAEVSDHLLVRPIRDRILLTFGIASTLLTLGACLVAYRLARRSFAPLRRLSDLVRHTHPDDLPVDFADQYPANEVGALATALQAALGRIARFVEREQNFTRDVSHELRTAIAVVSSSAELLSTRPAPDAEPNPIVERIRVASDHMARTVAALLSMAREENDARGPQTVLVAPLVERVVLQVGHLAAPRNAEVVVDVAPRATLEARPGVLEVLLANLIGNSLQHTRDGRVIVRLAGARLSVIDTGGGMDADVRSRAFSENTKGPRSAGLGRGLSIVRRVCEHHGIAWSVEHPDGGTAIHLSFELNPS